MPFGRPAGTEPARVAVPPSFEAVDAHGKLRRGLVDAETARQVRDQLRAAGPVPDRHRGREVVGDAAGGAQSGDATDRTRLPAAQVALSTRQLATLVRSGMPLDQALAAVAEQADDARTARLYRRHAPR